MCAKCYFTCTFIHGQLLVHLYALLSCRAASMLLWQINDDDDDDDDDDYSQKQ